MMDILNHKGTLQKMREYSESLEGRLTVEPRVEEVPDDGVGFWRPGTTRTKSSRPVKVRRVGVESQKTKEVDFLERFSRRPASQRRRLDPDYSNLCAMKINVYLA